MQPHCGPGKARRQDRSARADSRSLAFCSASTSSVLVMLERPLMPSRVASSYRCFLEAFASTPPAVGRSVSTPPSACSSEGPGRSLGSQRSPTFSCVCLSALKATRCARCSSPYCSAAESCALAKVLWALASDRCSVLGSSSWSTLPDFVVLGICPPWLTADKRFLA